MKAVPLLLAGCATEPDQQGVGHEHNPRVIDGICQHAKLAARFNPVIALEVADKCPKQKRYKRRAAQPLLG